MHLYQQWLSLDCYRVLRKVNVAQKSSSNLAHNTVILHAIWQWGTMAIAQKRYTPLTYSTLQYTIISSPEAIWYRNYTSGDLRSLSFYHVVDNTQSIVIIPKPLWHRRFWCQCIWLVRLNYVAVGTNLLEPRYVESTDWFSTNQPGQATLSSIHDILGQFLWARESEIARACPEFVHETSV